MKKKLLAVAVVGALASPVAFAQTLYGIVDLGYSNSKHADGDVNKNFINSGMHSGSRLGVRGSEDLAMGTYAMYQIEFEIVADSGATTPSGMTHRLTTLGLGSKAWGELTLGRQYTHTFHTFAVGSAAGYGTYASAFTWAGFVPSRASNSIKYSSPVMGGFSVGALWSFTNPGTNETESSVVGADQNYWDVAVRWTPGPIGVAASLANNTTETGGAETETDVTQISVNWDNRAFGIYGNWAQSETTPPVGAATADVSVWSVSGVGRFGGRHELYAVYGQRSDDAIAGDAGDSSLLGIGYQHVMSKRTRAYVGYASVKNKAGTNRAPTFFTGSNSLGGPAIANGYDPRGFQVGLVHSF